MALLHSPNIVRNGLVHLLEGSRAITSSQQILKDPISGNNWTANNFSIGNSGNLNSFLSNCDSTGAGTSNIVIAPTNNLLTGSITFILWFNLKNIPINVGSNNNWRGLLCTNTGGTSGSPLTMVLEQDRSINFTTTHTDISRRFLNNSFAPIVADANGWQMISYTYNKDTGIAACYKNDSLILSGPMTSNSSNGSPTSINLSLSYTNYTSGGSQTGFRIFGGTSTIANTTGNGIVPGELSNVMIYNVALSLNQIKQNFNALRGRYNI
jgi:hypothetical protein